jgi:hypothetical protein
MQIGWGKGAFILTRSRGGWEKTPTAPRSQMEPEGQGLVGISSVDFRLPVEKVKKSKELCRCAILSAA